MITTSFMDAADAYVPNGPTEFGPSLSPLAPLPIQVDDGIESSADLEEMKMYDFNANAHLQKQYNNQHNSCTDLSTIEPTIDPTSSSHPVTILNLSRTSSISANTSFHPCQPLPPFDTFFRGVSESDSSGYGSEPSSPEPSLQHNFNLQQQIMDTSSFEQNIYPHPSYTAFQTSDYPIVPSVVSSSYVLDSPTSDSNTPYYCSNVNVSPVTITTPASPTVIDYESDNSYFTSSMNEPLIFAPEYSPSCSPISSVCESPSSMSSPYQYITSASPAFVEKAEVSCRISGTNGRSVDKLVHFLYKCCIEKRYGCEWLDRKGRIFKIAGRDTYPIAKAWAQHKRNFAKHEHGDGDDLKKNICGNFTRAIRHNQSVGKLEKQKEFIQYVKANRWSCKQVYKFSETFYNNHLRHIET